MGDERGQPPVLLRHRYLPLAALGVERGYDLRRSDLAQRLVDRRHGICIANRVTVQIAIVASDVHTAGLLVKQTMGLAIGLTDGRLSPISNSSRI